MNIVRDISSTTIYMCNFSTFYYTQSMVNPILYLFSFDLSSLTPYSSSPRKSGNIIMRERVIVFFLINWQKNQPNYPITCPLTTSPMMGEKVVLIIRQSVYWKRQSPTSNSLYLLSVSIIMSSYNGIYLRMKIKRQ